MTLGRVYGSGSGPVWTSNLRCNGNETSLADCPSNGWGLSNCAHDSDVSIACDNRTGTGKCHCSRDESILGIPMGALGPVGILWEWESLS